MVAHISRRLLEATSFTLTALTLTAHLPGRTQERCTVPEFDAGATNGASLANKTLLRRAYAAIRRGDLTGFLAVRRRPSAYPEKVYGFWRNSVLG